MIDNVKAILCAFHDGDHMLAHKLVLCQLLQTLRVCFNYTVSDGDLGRAQIIDIDR